MSEIVQMIF